MIFLKLGFRGQITRECDFLNVMKITSLTKKEKKSHNSYSTL